MVLYGERERRTRRHVEGAAAAKVGAHLVGGGQTKVGEEDPFAFLVAEDVLRLEVSVVDAKLVAEGDGVDDLEEDGANEVVVAEVARLVGDHAEEVAVGAEGEDDVDDAAGFDDAVEADDVGVGGGQGVEGDLSALKAALTGVEAGLVETLDGVVPSPCVRGGRVGGDGSADAGGDIFGEVDHTVGAEAEDRHELKAVLVDGVAQKSLVLCCGGVVEGHSLGLKRRATGGNGRCRKRSLERSRKTTCWCVDIRELF